MFNARFQLPLLCTMGLKVLIILLWNTNNVAGVKPTKHESKTFTDNLIQLIWF